ncbi:hypothetical protein [Vibrio palustris]|uniref:Uncharacterized protein n=1 Tax=Vibrio palustris TaxID=1918946 RepID=A0A1R4B2B7_9VIBR|nr:hypothetical protein [Vibrio palustris]SJL83057.1 hypothetical protein VPAL9027_01005 [Vibrio palustris]
MVWKTLERVNQLRQAAMSDPEFIQSAQEHEKMLQFVEQTVEPKKRSRSSTIASRKAKSLADIYEKAAFGENSSGQEH